MSLANDMEVMCRRHYKKNNWNQPSAIHIGRAALVQYIKELNEKNAAYGIAPLPQDTRPDCLYFKGVKLTLVDSLDGVEIVA